LDAQQVLVDCRFLLLTRQIPIRVVAVNHDTSTAMIERTYSKHIGDHADALTRPAVLDLSKSTAGNVVPLTREGRGGGSI
jgi:hypothetical protein